MEVSPSRNIKAHTSANQSKKKTQVVNRSAHIGSLKNKQPQGSLLHHQGSRHPTQPGKYDSVTSLRYNQPAIYEGNNSGMQSPPSTIKVNRKKGGADY